MNHKEIENEIKELTAQVQTLRLELEANIIKAKRYSLELLVKDLTDEANSLSELIENLKGV